MKKLLSGLFCLLLVLTIMLPMPVSADEVQVNEQTTITYLPDGSYNVTTIREYPISTVSTVRQTSGTKTIANYDNSGNIRYSLTVEGTFSYNGTTSQALSASYSYTTEGLFWGFSSGSAVYQGNTATATGTFTYLLFVQSQTLSVSLSCSPTGVLS